MTAFTFGGEVGNLSSYDTYGNVSGFPYFIDALGSGNSEVTEMAW